jgi:hypothetical protein
MAAKKNLVLCPCCKGIGYVKNEKGAVNG